MRIALLLLLLISQTAAQTSDIPVNVPSKPEWRHVVTSEHNRKTSKAYYDAAHIERRKSGTLRVWLKQVPITKTEIERQRVIDGIVRNRKLNQMKVEGYERYAYSVTLMEIDCPGSRGRSIAIWDYDQADKLLGSDSIEDMPFAPIREQSMAALLRDAACKK